MSRHATQARATNARRRIAWGIGAALLAAALPLTSVAQDSPALDWVQSQQRLEQVSDALAAADASVRNKEDLQDATRLLRLPEITGEVRRLQFQKTLTLPLGSLTPVAEAFGIDSPLQFTERDWRTRPVVTAVLPLYTGGLIPAAQQAAAGATEQANAERDAQRQSLSVQLAQAYFGQQLAEQAVNVRRDVRDGMQRHLDDALKLEREGFATRAQRLQANVARDKAEREYQKALNDLQTLKAALSTLLRSGGEVRPISPLFVHRAPLGDVASFERVAQARQPQIARLRAVVAQAEQGVRVQQAKLKPTVYLFGQYDFRRRDEMITDPDWAFGIGLKYTFLSPSSRPAQIRAARAQQEQAEAACARPKTRWRWGYARPGTSWRPRATSTRCSTAASNSRARTCACRNWPIAKARPPRWMSSTPGSVWVAPAWNARRPPISTTWRWRSCWRSVDRWTAMTNSDAVRTR